MSKKPQNHIFIAYACVRFLKGFVSFYVKLCWANACICTFAFINSYAQNLSSLHRDSLPAIPRAGIVCKKNFTPVTKWK